MTSQVLTTQASPCVDAFARLLRSHAALTRELSARLLTDHGLSITDYQCLLTLAHAENGEMRRVDLAEQLMLTPSGVTRLLDGLERDGWVTKGSCSSDARVTYAVLTEEGRERLESAGRSHLRQIRAIFEECFADEELETLVDLLGRLPGATGYGETCSPEGGSERGVGARRSASVPAGSPGGGSAAHSHTTTSASRTGSAGKSFGPRSVTSRAITPLPSTPGSSPDTVTT